MNFFKRSKNRVNIGVRSLVDIGTRNRVQNVVHSIPKIILTDYDTGVHIELNTDGTVKQQLSNAAYDFLMHRHINTKRGSEMTSITNMHESEEEDREIIQSLTKAHSSNSKKNVDVDVVVARSPTEWLKEKIQESLKRKPTEEDIIDMEVSQLTSLIESKKAFLPIHGPVKFVSSISSTDSTSPHTPPGKLPDISDVNKPECAPTQTVANVKSGFDDAHSDESADIEVVGQGTPEMDHCESSHCLSREPTSNHAIWIRRLIRRNSQHSSSSSSVDVIEEHSTGSDEHPPQYWKLHDNNSTDKSDVTEDEKMDEVMENRHVIKPVTDDNSSSMSRDNCND